MRPVRTVRRRAGAWLFAALLGLALVVAPARAHATTAEPDDLARALRYTACALAIAGATGGWGIAAAVVGCLVLVAD